MEVPSNLLLNIVSCHFFYTCETVNYVLYCTLGVHIFSKIIATRKVT